MEHGSKILAMLLVFTILLGLVASAAASPKVVEPEVTYLPSGWTLSEKTSYGEAEGRYGDAGAIMYETEAADLVAIQYEAVPSGVRITSNWLINEAVDMMLDIADSVEEDMGIYPIVGDIDEVGTMSIAGTTAGYALEETPVEGVYLLVVTMVKGPDYIVVASVYEDEVEDEVFKIIDSIKVEEEGGGFLPKCIIATATYGSEAAAEVQFLREFREDVVYRTFAGREFMEVFHAWYYSWSPPAARFIEGNEAAKAFMRAALYPLLGILHLATLTYTALSFNEEVAIVAAGLVASVLIGVAYFAPPAIVLLGVLRRLRGWSLRLSQLKPLALTWALSALMIYVSWGLGASILMKAATSLFVLSSMALAAGALASKIVERLL